MEDHKVEMLGFTCAACHTSDLRFQGQTLRVDGSSGLFYVDQLGDQLADSLKATLEDPEEFLAFLRRLVAQPEADTSLRGPLEKVVSLPLGLVRTAAVHEIHAQFASLLDEIRAEDKRLSAAASSVEAGQPGFFQRFREKLTADLEAQKNKVLSDILPHLPPLIKDIQARLGFLKVRHWLSSDPAHRLAGGYGRADDFGTARVELYGFNDPRNLVSANAPVSIPPLWNIQRYNWLHWNANTNSVLQRSIGEAIGVGAPKESVHVVNQMYMEVQLRKLTAPTWPDFFGKPNAVKVEKGREIYAENCAGCHSPQKLNDKGLVELKLVGLDEIGTDPNDAKNFDRAVFNKDGTTIGFARAISTLLNELQDKAYTAMNPQEKELMVDLETNHTPAVWRDTLTETGGPVYPAKPLEGIWATAPFLHNGSVPTLYHLLRPAERPGKFLVGQKDFDPVRVGFEIRPDRIPRDAGVELFEFNTDLPGNHNTGHEYGANLSDEDCEALIEYLKVHRDIWPEPASGQR